MPEEVGLYFGGLATDIALVNIRSAGHQLNSILLTFQNQGSMYKSGFSTNAQSRFASVVFDGVSAPLTVFLFLCSSGSNAQGESRALERRRVSSKSPKGSEE